MQNSFRAKLPYAAMLMLGALIGAALYFVRDLWFDEALTLLNFAMPLGYGEIYTHYTIPNNQIVYTMLMKFWLELNSVGVPLDFWCRIPSIIFGLCGIGLLWHQRCREGADRITGFTVLAAFALFPAFGIYATAVRGYMLSFFLIALALNGAWRFLATERQRLGLVEYTLASLLAVGTIPTNLAALGGVVLYAIPWCGKRFWSSRRFWILAIVPLAMFALFWGPIAGELLTAAQRGEGLGGQKLALRESYALLLFGFPVLQLLLLGGILREARWHRRLFLLRHAALLLPLATVLLLPVAPFPRTWLPLATIWIMLLADNAMAFIAGRSDVKAQRNHRWMVLGTTMLVVILQVLTFQDQRFRIPAKMNPDDFVVPWYCSKSFQIKPTAEWLAKNYPQRPQGIISFGADPFPVWFYASMAGVEDSSGLLPDMPAGAIRQLDDGALVILQRDESPTTYEERFGGKLHERWRSDFHRIWRFRKDN